MKTLDWCISDDVPDSTYFRIGDCEPRIQDGQVIIFHGEGTKRGWGKPQVTSTVVVDEIGFLAVHIGFSHKHKGNQFWRYYEWLDGDVVDGQWNPGQIQTRLWKQLPDEKRMMVLDAWTSLDDWIRRPGKLTSEYINSASNTQTAYKMVQVTNDGLYVSLYDPDVIYEIDQRVRQHAKPEHGGGFYTFKSIIDLKRAWQQLEMVPLDRLENVFTVAILECQISGTIVEYGEKTASTYLTPLAEVERGENNLHDLIEKRNTEAFQRGKLIGYRTGNRWLLEPSGVSGQFLHAFQDGIEAGVNEMERDQVQAFQEGGESARLNQPFSDNPHEFGSHKHLAWNDGWSDARGDMESSRVYVKYGVSDIFG